MVGAVGVAHAGAPESGREDEDGEQEEDSGDLEQDDGAGAAEGLKEASDGAGDAAAALASDARGGDGLRYGGGLR